MQQTGIDVLDRTVQLTNQWLEDVGAYLDTPDRQTAYRAMRAVLLGVRDRIGADNAAHLAAQLPLLIRGIFYDGFRPSATPSRERSREAFLGKLDHAVFRGLQIDPERAAKAVLRVMAEHIDPNEIEKVAQLFPEELRDLWPDVADLPPRPSKRAGATERPHADRR
ncbi:MAG: DUF2267 domain-containing protein [Pseudomonadota bacterium]